MNIRVRLFAVAREAAGADFIDVDVPTAADAAESTGVNVGALRSAFMARLPQLAPTSRQLLFAVDGEYATDATLVKSGSEVACIPPVSGG